MDRDRRDVSDRLHVPDLAEQLVLREDVVRIFREKCKQIKFLCRELRLLAVDPDAARRLVNLQTADLDDVIFLRTCADKPLISREMGLHARDKLARRERLCDLIVRTETEAPDLVDVILLG